MGITVYISTVSSNQEIKKQQQRITMVLDSKKIPYEKIDIASLESAKDEMRRIAGNSTQLPPYICNGEQKCGDFEQFESAVEEENLDEFLKIN